MKRIVWFLIILGAMMLACSLPGLQSPTPDNTGPSAPDSTTPLAPGTVDTPAPDKPVIPFLATPTTMPSNPIGIRQGLASLDSYRLEIRFANLGPTSQDRSEITFQVETASDGESWHITNSVLSSSAEEPEVNTSQSNQYKVGTIMCEVSEDDSEVDVNDMDPQVTEILDVWTGLLDLVPVVNDPVFIGSEIMNGVQTNHFQFDVSGLGVDSGAEVVASDGEYWLAVDGQYVVKYVVHLETRDGPAGDANTETLRSDISIEVRDINQPIEITLPANCQ